MIIRRTIIGKKRGAIAPLVGVLALALCVSGGVLRPAKRSPQTAVGINETPGIVWDAATQVCIEGGATYGRIARLTNR